MAIAMESDAKQYIIELRNMDDKELVDEFNHQAAEYCLDEPLEKVTRGYLIISQMAARFMRGVRVRFHVYTTPNTLPDRLKAMRKEKGMTLLEVSNLTNLSVSFLSDLERGRTRPSLSTLEKLTSVYQKSLTIDIPFVSKSNGN